LIAAERVVFITYPGHLLTTAASINHFRTFHNYTQDIAVVIDDINPASTNQYWKLAVDMYESRGCEIYTASSFPIDQITTGWIRQQIVKLSLDLVFDDQSWLCVDADSMIYADLSSWHVPVRSVYIDDLGVDQAFGRYVNDCGLRYFDTIDWSEPLRTNAVPFRFMSRYTLQQLRNWVTDYTKQDFFDLHRTWFAADRNTINQTGRLMTEFELIENFNRCVLDHTHAIVHYDLIKFGGLWRPTRPSVATYWGSDRDIADRHFVQHGVSQNELNRAKLLQSS
jgi:hypothetical protein